MKKKQRRIQKGGFPTSIEIFRRETARNYLAAFTHYSWFQIFLYALGQTWIQEKKYLWALNDPKDWTEAINS